MSSSTPNQIVWPTTCEIPDLSALFAGNSLDFALNRMFWGGGPQNSAHYALMMNYIRVVDILVEDYESARSHFLAALNTGDGMLPLHAMLLAVGNFENCVTTLLRAIRFAGQLLAASLPGPIPRTLAVLAAEDDIRQMRNAIEHLDERILRKVPVKGDPVCLMIYPDRIELFNKTIKYKNLAEWVRELHGLAISLAQYKEV